MKKLITFMLALCVCLSATVMADTAKDLRKAREKQKKEKMKQLKKEKWAVFGTTRTLDVALLEHYNKLETLGDKGHEVVGVASNFKSKNIGVQSAINNACFTYAQEEGSKLRGMSTSDMMGSESNGDGEFDHFYAAYERQIEKEIRGEMKQSFSLIRDNGNGTSDLQTFFIIDESDATAARKRALEAALEETDLAQQNAKKISDFINSHQ